MEENKKPIDEKEVMRVNYENNMLKQKLQEAYSVIENLSNTRGIERLRFLFTIVENKGGRFDDAIITKAVTEITESMFPSEEDVKKDE